MNYKNTNQAINELLANEDFILWNFLPTPELDRVWNDWMEEHPELVEDLYAARSILKSVHINDFSLSDADYLRLKERISISLNKLENANLQKKAKTKTNSYLIRAASIAAIFIIGIISGIVYFSEVQEDKTFTQDVQSQLTELNPDHFKETTLLVDNEQFQLSENATIQYSANGEITKIDLANETGVDKKNRNKASEKYNQLIVPKGRRANLKLSDGSIIWVNSGTILIYPHVFKGETRNIFIRGEAYMEIAKNEKAPFIVATQDFKVNVLGTKLNISNYKELKQSKVILVEGVVDIVGKNEQSIRLQPNEIVSLTDGEIIEKNQINAKEYIGWVDGLIVLNGTDIPTLVHRLSNYYGINISCDPSLNKASVYGKLDLRNNIEDVLDCVNEITPIRIDKNGDNYMLWPNNKDHRAK